MNFGGFGVIFPFSTFMPKRNKRLTLICSGKKKLSQSLLGWSKEDRRALPWRKTRDPYRILVSEVMLQQTQVSRVAVKYKEFLQQFPTLVSLSRAQTSDVIRAWSGLGYNSRALRLQRLAQLVVERHGGKIPTEPSLLLQLPGVGKYTANAIASFAFEKDVPVVDTNIRRVLSRLFSKMRSPDERTSEASAWEVAEALLPRARSRTWTLALMDLGATICTARRPLCAQCPVSKVCRSAFLLNGGKATNQSAKREPSHEGIPNRIYRGRIVEALRNVNGEGSLQLRRLGERIKIPFRRSEEVWLRSLLVRLQRDGLVKMTSRASGDVRVSLP